VFCVDQEHADEMRRALNNLNADIVRDHPDYVCRVTADEGHIGRGHLSRFQELETRTPTILTTSQLLTTGVDAPTCKNVVLARVVGSMTEFKQIIGRGTRVRDDYGKLFFSILDYTGSATRLFADPEFDGDPAFVTQEEIDADGEVVATTHEGPGEDGADVAAEASDPYGAEEREPRRKYYVDGERVEIAAHLVHEFDSDGRQLRVVSFMDYAAEKVRTLYPSLAEMRERWADPEGRSEVIAMLEERGIDFDELVKASRYPEADPFDLLCHLAFDAPLRTRRERAERLRSEKKDFFERYGTEAQGVLDELLEKYAEHGTAQFVMPGVLKVPPISEHGNVREIAVLFGGTQELRKAIHQLQRLLYAA
jgi:type I restriction enzyme R subunit